jgi:hypothetical protein
VGESKIIRSWVTGCVRQGVMAVGILLALGIGLAGLVVLTGLLPIQPSQRIYVWVGGMLFLFFLVVGGLFVWSTHMLRQRAAHLDAAFNQLGLPGKAYLWNGRQYHATLSGRQVDAYFSRGPSLVIYIAAQLNTRLGIRLKGSLSQMASAALNRPELITSDPELAHLGIFPLDERWGRALLVDPQAKAAILRLTSAETAFEFRNLLFQPEAIQFQIHRIHLSGICAENLRIWVNDLFTLAKIAESLPSPTVTSMASAIERKTRSNRGDILLPIVGITCGIVGFFAVIIFILMVLFYSLSKGGI